MGFFGAAHGWGAGGTFCHTSPIMMKLGTVIPYLKKIQKLYELRDTPLEFCWHGTYFTGSHQILLYQEIQIKIPFRHIVSDSSNFSWVFKDCFNKHGDNFDDVKKIATSGLLKDFFG